MTEGHGRYWPCPSRIRATNTPLALMCLGLATAALGSSGYARGCSILLRVSRLPLLSRLVRIAACEAANRATGTR